MKRGLRIYLCVLLVMVMACAAKAEVPMKFNGAIYGEMKYTPEGLLQGGTNLLLSNMQLINTQSLGAVVDLGLIWQNSPSEWSFIAPYDVAEFNFNLSRATIKFSGKAFNGMLDLNGALGDIYINYSPYIAVMEGWANKRGISFDLPKLKLLGTGNAKLSTFYAWERGQALQNIYGFKVETNIGNTSLSGSMCNFSQNTAVIELDPVTGAPIGTLHYGPVTNSDNAAGLEFATKVFGFRTNGLLALRVKKDLGTGDVYTTQKTFAAKLDMSRPLGDDGSVKLGYRKFPAGYKPKYSDATVIDPLLDQEGVTVTGEYEISNYTLEASADYYRKCSDENYNFVSGKVKLSTNLGGTRVSLEARDEYKLRSARDVTYITGIFERDLADTPFCKLSGYLELNANDKSIVETTGKAEIKGSIKSGMFKDAAFFMGTVVSNHIPLNKVYFGLDYQILKDVNFKYRWTNNNTVIKPDGAIDLEDNVIQLSMTVPF